MKKIGIQLQKALIILIIIIPIQVLSQNKTVSIQAKNLALHDVLKDIGTQTAFNYILNDDVISPDTKVNMNVKDVNIDFVMGYSSLMTKLMEDKKLLDQYKSPTDFILEAMNLLFYGIVTK